MTDGVRVTVAFELYRDGVPDPMADALLQERHDLEPPPRPPWPPPRAAAPAPTAPAARQLRSRPRHPPQRAEAVRAAFAAVVADRACLPEGGQLGFEAAHLYEEKELSATEKALQKASAKDISTRKMKAGLKNEDAVLAVAAAAAGLRLEVKRVLSDGNGYCEQEWELAKMPASDRGFGRVRNCDGMRAKGITPDEIDAYAAGEARRAPPEPGASRRAAGRLHVPLVLSPRSSTAPASPG